MKNDIDKTISELQVLSEDNKEREKLISLARDNFFKTRVDQATKLERLRSKIIDKIEQDIERGSLPPAMQLRYLETISRINEADLSSISTPKVNSPGVTIVNSNNSSNIKSDIEELSKSIRVVSSSGNELIKNPADAQQLIDTVDSIKHENILGIFEEKNK